MTLMRENSKTITKPARAPTSPPAARPTRENSSVDREMVPEKSCCRTETLMTVIGGTI